MSGILDSVRSVAEDLSSHLTGPEKVLAAGVTACIGVAGLVFAGPALADAGSAVATFLALDAKTIVSAGLGAGAVVGGAWKAIAGRAERTAQRAANHAAASDARAALIAEDFGIGDPSTPPVRTQLSEIRAGVSGIVARHEALEKKVDAQGAAALRAYGEVSKALSTLACDPYDRKPSAATRAIRASHAKRAAKSGRREKRGKR